MRALALWVIACASLGCGGSDTTYKAAGYTLSVGDEGYYSDAGSRFCPAGGTGQLLLDYVDYNFICDPKNAPQRDNRIDHLELQIILTVGQPPDYGQHYPTAAPYPVGHADCKNGPTEAAIGQLLHYAAMATTPNRIVQADSGSVTIKQFDPNWKKTLTGNFDLKFGADEIKDSFSLEACN
jgi:hypothetical protein